MILKLTTIYFLVILNMANGKLTSNRFASRITKRKEAPILNSYQALNNSKSTTEILDETLRKYLMKFRSRMSRGTPNLKVPILDPMEIEEIGFETENLSIGKVVIRLEKVKVKYLSTFEILRTKLFLTDTLSIFVEVLLPRIRLNGIFHLSGMLGKMIPVSESSPFQAVLHDVKVTVDTVFDFFRGMCIKRLDFKFSLKTIELSFKNETTRAISQEEMTRVYSALQLEMKSKLRDYLVNTANETWNSLTIRDISNFSRS